MKYLQLIALSPPRLQTLCSVRYTLRPKNNAVANESDTGKGGCLGRSATSRAKTQNGENGEHIDAIRAGSAAIGDKLAKSLKVLQSLTPSHLA